MEVGVSGGVCLGVCRVVGRCTRKQWSGRREHILSKMPLKLQPLIALDGTTMEAMEHGP